MWLLVRYLQWATTNFVITSDRVIFRHGVFAKTGIEIPLERVNSVHFNQSIFERMIGAGDLLIESGAEDGQQRFTDVKNPDQVQNLIHSQMEVNEDRMYEGQRTGAGCAGDRRPDDAAREARGLRDRGTLRRRGVRGPEAAAARRSDGASVTSPRLVSLVPSATETLLALGADVVACTRFCEQPAARHVGGTKNPDVAAIVALAPDVVVVDEEENRREDADALAAGRPRAARHRGAHGRRRARRGRPAGRRRPVPTCAGRRRMPGDDRSRRRRPRSCRSGGGRG